MTGNLGVSKGLSLLDVVALLADRPADGLAIAAEELHELEQAMGTRHASILPDYGGGRSPVT